jgi:hypothetical protein
VVPVGDSKKVGVGFGRRFRSKSAKQRISESDAYRSAKLIIDQHGEKAATLACRRVDFFLGEGDAGAAAVWRQILVAIEALRRGRRKSDRLN